ncbi:MAG: hypothetical protein ACK4N5_03950 [Myxococcales bacterium]
MSARVLLVSLLLVSASTASAAEPKSKVAVLPLKPIGVEPQIAEIATDALAKAIQDRGFQVITPKDVEAALGYERQKASVQVDVARRLGEDSCSADVECLKEISGAMGAPWMVSGSIARLGSSFSVSAQLFDQRRAVVTRRAQQNASAADESAFLELARLAAAELFPDARPQPQAGTVSLGGAVSLSSVPALPENLRTGGAIDVDVDADVLVAYDAALQADARGADRPDAAAEAWAKVASFTRKNPYRDDAAVRAKHWREFGQRQRELAQQREADRQQLKKILPLSAVGVDRKEQLIAQYAKLYGGEAVVELIGEVQPADVRSQLCTRYAAYRGLGSGEALEVRMPRVDGVPLRGRILVDGQFVADAPAPVLLVPSCATRVKVEESSGRSWGAELAGLGRTDSGAMLAEPAFEGILDDEAKARIPPPPSPADSNFHATVEATYFALGERTTLRSTSRAPLGRLRVGYDLFEFMGFDVGVYGPSSPAFFAGMNAYFGDTGSGRFRWQAVAVNLQYALVSGGIDMLFGGESVFRVRYGPVGLRLQGGVIGRYGLSSGAPFSVGVSGGGGVELNFD